jgi:hypothetical protein
MNNIKKLIGIILKVLNRPVLKRLLCTLQKTGKAMNFQMCFNIHKELTT